MERAGGPGADFLFRPRPILWSWVGEVLELMNGKFERSPQDMSTLRRGRHEAGNHLVIPANQTGANRRSYPRPLRWARIDAMFSLPGVGWRH